MRRAWQDPLEQQTQPLRFLVVFKTEPMRTAARGRISPQQREHKAPHCRPDQTSIATTKKTPDWLVSQGVPTPSTNAVLDLFSISFADLAQKRRSTPPLKWTVRGGSRLYKFSVCWYEQHGTKPAAFRARTTPTNAAGRVPRANAARLYQHRERQSGFGKGDSEEMPYKGETQYLVTPPVRNRFSSPNGMTEVR